ncbi:PREDICTED: uncharacterized protein LOC109230434 [Nicotiana attenuata]|uniref:Uncharacterized protein n=1 Tax=Nicotiana attenuata TaxID=49451 RepID=A0A1J6IZ10_NICAT|nr:PREDICTED: uncharacterized protein LOC109230434 [Nicotiana attenuata]OIT00337.1 hypothetical protein A4A49_30848 [Nicotiana attenuata]
MEDIKSATPATKSKFTKGFLYFTTSLQQCCRYIKAFFVGQGKKMTARSEEEATQADMLKAKMEVEAADAAENTKKRLDNSN